MSEKFDNLEDAQKRCAALGVKATAGNADPPTRCEDLRDAGALKPGANKVRLMRKDKALMATQPVNLALGAVVYPAYTTYGQNAQKIVDGKISGAPNPGNPGGSNWGFQYHTPNMANPFVQLALQATATSPRVVVYNRKDACCGDRLAGAKVYVTATDRSAMTAVDPITMDTSELCGTVANASAVAGSIHTFNCPATAKGRYVFIIIPGSPTDKQSIQLLEVSVYAGGSKPVSELVDATCFLDGSDVYTTIKCDDLAATSSCASFSKGTEGNTSVNHALSHRSLFQYGAKNRDLRCVWHPSS